MCPDQNCVIWKVSESLGEELEMFDQMKILVKVLISCNEICNQFYNSIEL